MILDLTIGNLQKAGYTEEEINRLYNAKNDCTLNTLYKSKNIFVSKTENKFYTGIDFYRKTYFDNGNLRFPFMCTDLFSEYFELTLNKFLEKQKNELSIHFDKKAQINKFITKETISNRQIIDENKEYIKSNPKRQWIGKERTINILETYIDFLDNKLFINNQSQQTEAVNSDVILKNEYILIFKNDIGFTLFDKMFELYKNETNHLANFSFLFYAMEKEFLVCSQAKFKEFLRDEKYNIEIEKIDNRQWFLDMDRNKKSKLYKSIKESLQEKHGKSTI